MKFVRLLIVPFALALVLFSRAIARWKLIRFGRTFNFRLGHLIGNNENYLCERGIGRQGNCIDLWVDKNVPCAHPLILKKYKQHMTWLPWWFGDVVLKVNKLFPNWERHICAPECMDRDINNLWGKPHIGFTEKEELEGQKLLRKLGLEGKKWVCLFVRDSSYLASRFPNENYSYHDYRDSDIIACKKAVWAFYHRGYKVIRMGAKTAKTVDFCLDYANSTLRTDFGSLYLGAKCAFAFGTHAGFMSIPQVFNRPIGIINYVPLEYMPTFANGIIIWKHHMKDGKQMTVKEIHESGAGIFTDTRMFEQAGIKLVDNSPDEILSLAYNMCNFAEGNFYSDDKEFWKSFPRSMANGARLHGEITIRVGHDFIRDYA
ncbi:TIGR04372 family glycosyltransferase [bacterium]|nr:TIGR04372 family glycosyltransferase [bacterium]